MSENENKSWKKVLKNSGQGEITGTGAHETCHWWVRPVTTWTQGQYQCHWSWTVRRVSRWNMTGTQASLVAPEPESPEQPVKQRPSLKAGEGPGSGLLPSSLCEFDMYQSLSLFKLLVYRKYGGREEWVKMTLWGIRQIQKVEHSRGRPNCPCHPATACRKKSGVGDGVVLSSLRFKKRLRDIKTNAECGPCVNSVSSQSVVTFAGDNKGNLYVDWC